ncbi:hypothetical protein IWW48_002416 [Coemansia sp. RSA 1200]|nr:hypothetical protein IWW48_002416 [Coemansia sp. RSA 1200]
MSVISLSYFPDLGSVESSVPGAPVDTKSFNFMWQRPFTYEAKVYVSTKQYVPHSESRFFDKAVMVWRSGPQTLDNKIPHLHARVAVPLPESLARITESVHNGLYAHIFVQGAFSTTQQNPDLEDPLLIHSVMPVVWWEPPEEDGVFRFVSSHGHPVPLYSRNSNSDYQLVAKRSVSWGMTVSSNAVLMTTLVGCKEKRWLENDASVATQMILEFNPLIFENLVTRSTPRVDVLLEHRNNGPLPKSIDIDIDLEEIKDHYLAAKVTMLLLSGQKFMTCPRIAPISTNSVNPLFKHRENLNSASLSQVPGAFSRYIYDNSAAKLLVVIIVTVMLLSLNLISMKILTSYWLGPKSKWIGMSRATFALFFAGTLMEVLRKTLTDDEEINMIDYFELSANTYVLLLLLGESLNPLVWLRFIIAQVVKFRKGKNAESINILPIDIDLKSEWQTTEDVYESKKPAHESGLSSSQVAKIVAAREHVDRMTIPWARKIAIVSLAIFSLYSIYQHGFNPFSLDYVHDICFYMVAVIMAFFFVPQLVVNYRTRSARHNPPIDHLNHVATAIIGTLLSCFAGVDIWGKTAISSIPGVVCSIIALVQYCKYFKEKSD